MTDNTEPTFTAEEGFKVQKQMRDALGLGPEAFPLAAFVGMISDEIEQLRAAGKSDADIAAMVNDTIGKTIRPEDIAAHYATPEQRHFGA